MSIETLKKIILCIPFLLLSSCDVINCEQSAARLKVPGSVCNTFEGRQQVKKAFAIWTSKEIEKATGKKVSVDSQDEGVCWQTNTKLRHKLMLCNRDCSKPKAAPLSLPTPAKKGWKE